jgi:hypothetical protein
MPAEPIHQKRTSGIVASSESSASIFNADYCPHSLVGDEATFQ